MWNSNLDLSGLHTQKTDFVYKYSERNGEDKPMLAHPREINLELLARTRI